MNMNEFRTEKEEEYRKEIERFKEEQQKIREKQELESQSRSEARPEDININDVATDDIPRMVEWGVDIQKFEMVPDSLDYIIHTSGRRENCNLVAILSGYDFTNKIEELAKPEMYLTALECLKDYNKDAFLHPEDRNRLKNQCDEMTPWMDDIMEHYIIYEIDQDNDFGREWVSEEYNDFKRGLKEEKKRAELKRAELKRRKEERVSNRLAGARKTLAKQIDRTLGTNLTDRKIPEKAKKVERKINDTLFSSKGGKEAE